MESELGRVVDALPGFVWTAFPDGQIDFLNQRWRDYTGLEADRSRGRGWQVAIHSEDLSGLLTGWRGVPASGAAVETEARVRGSDGQYRWFLFRAHPSADASGQVVKWCGLSTDIDHRRQAEEALRASERRFRLIVDGLPVLLSTATPDGELEQANRHYLEYFGATLEELKAGEAVHSLHPDDRPRVLSARGKGIDTGQPYEIECRRRRADGVYRWFSLRAFPLRDSEGRIALWYRLQTDIEEQKRAEARHAGEKQLLDMVASGRPMSDILEALCRFVESMASECYCSVVLLDPSGTKLQEAIAPSLGVEFNEAVRGWPLDRLGGPCVMAARDKIQVIMPDVATDARWRNAWRALAQAHGLRSCWSTPIVSLAGKVLGTFALYQHEPGSPDPFQLELISQFTSIASITIERVQRDAALRESEARLVEAECEMRLTLDSIPTITWRAAANGYVEQLNKRWYEYTGTTPEQVRGWRWKLCVHPDDLGRLVDIGTEYVATGTPIDGEARLRRFDGTYRWFLFRPAPARDESGNIIGWYGSITDIEDRKRAEEALRESEARLSIAEREVRHMLDSIPTMTWRAAPNGYVEHINKQAFDYPGATSDEMEGNRWHHVVHPDDLPGLLATGNANVPAGRPLDHEARLLRFDGEYRWFLFRLAPSRDETGKVIAWYGSITDIEDRKQAEEALRQSEAQLARAERELRLTLDSIPTMTWRSAPDGYVQQINRQFFDYTGTTPEQVRGKGWQSTVHPDDLQPILDIGRAYVSSGIPIDAETRLRRFDGTYRWFLFRPAPARDEAGNIIAWYGSITDIEDRKRAEEKLQRSETFLAEGQRISSTGTFSWRVDTDELTFSEELYRIFELDQNAVVTFERVFARIHPDDTPLLSERMKLVRAGRGPLEQEIRLRMPDDRIKYLRTVGQMVHHQDGRSEYLGAIQDVTQRRLAEETVDKVRSELAHVTRVMSLGALTASIAHEVNQPLAGIVTNASTCLRMLAADPPNVEGARETARRTIRDGNRAADVITRLRALFSKKATATETVDLTEAAREVLALVFSDLLRSRVTLRAELGDEPLLVTGDRVQLQQVILNLVRNATDAMSDVDDRPRHLLVRADTEGDDRARLIVKDAGVGFEPQGAERLFDAFYTTKAGGMGIGLSVSRSIIEGHGGRLWAEPNDGPGATFSFSIPRRTTSAEDEGTESAYLTRPTTGAYDVVSNA